MAQRLFPLTPSADPVRALSRAMEGKDWRRFNQIIAQGLRDGTLECHDLDLCPITVPRSQPSTSGRLEPLYEKALAHKHEGHQEAFWLMHSWEAALKTGQLARVTAQMEGSTDGSSTTLRGLFSGMRRLLGNVQCDYEYDRINFQASRLKPDTATGVRRLLYRLPNEINWPGKVLEQNTQSDNFSDDDSSGWVVRARPGARVYVEGVDCNAYNDGGGTWWSYGTVFFGDDTAAMDAFVAKRGDLAHWESMIGLLGTLGRDGARGELVQRLSSPEGPDMLGEHRQATSRLLHHACAEANEEAISALLAHGAHPGRLPHESRGPAWDLVEALDSRQIDVTSASVAACLDRLIGAGLDINETTLRLGQTLLVKAATLNHGAVEMLLLLVCRGADPFVKDAQGQDLFEAAKAPTDPSDHRYTPCALAFLDSLKAKIAVDKMLESISGSRVRLAT